MNRRQIGAVVLAAAVGLTGLGVLGAVGLPSPVDASPAGTQAPPEATPTDEPAATPTDAPSEEDIVNGTQLLAESPQLVTADGQVLRGETPLSPGTELTMRLVSTGPSPFIRSVEPAVRDDGTFNGSFDLSGVTAGSDARLIVIHAEHGELVNRTVTIEAAEGSNDGSGPDETPTPDDDATIDHEGDALTLASAPDQVVTGTTDLEEGTEVTVRLQSTGGEQPFLMQTSATVDEDGRFQVSFDLANIEPRVTFRAVLRHDGEELTAAPGEVTED